MIKVCTKCKQEKDLTLFSNRSNTKDGKDIYCKICKQEMSNKWKKENPDKNKECQRLSDRKWYDNNKQHKLQINNEWKKKNQKHVQKWYRSYKTQREATDPAFKITNKIRNRLWYAMKGRKKHCSFDEYTGCSRDFLVKYIESKFQLGMTWENYGEWEIDHIQPLYNFVLTEKEELLKACHYTNLQPLWKIDHKQKTKKDLSGNSTQK